MEKIDFSKQFSYRLREAMLAANFNSSRSTSGVSIHKLAEITGYSVQICRRYLRGEAIPEPVKLMEIAEELKVSPGWLLFGDSHSHYPDNSQKITINKNLLRYIVTHTAQLYNDGRQDDDVSDFLLELIQDVSQINASEDQSKKIIDLALSSIKHFNY